MEISADGDKVSLSYEIIHDGDRYTVSFYDVRFDLSQTTKQKYAKKELSLVLFDRIGETDVTFEGLVPEAFRIPANVSYEKSEKGYYMIESGTRLSFRKQGTDDVILKFPMYLACQEKKRRYELVEKFSMLRIPINMSTTEVRRTDSPSKSVTTDPITKKSDTTDEEERNVDFRLKKFVMQLDDQDKLPFSTALENEYYELKVIKDELDNVELVRSINKALKAYDGKKEELEEQADMDAQAAKDEAERIEQQQKKEEQAKMEEAERQATEAEEKAKKRTIGMIIGGVILSVLGFIGNQFSHHFRNLRNQRSMVEIQESLTRRAESEARRRASNAVRSTANRAINSTVGKSRDAVRERVQRTERQIKDKAKSKISNKKISI